MNNLATFPELGQLIEKRTALLRCLADSLDSSTPALVSNDVEAIARGASHQAELCRQWSQLEAELRQQTAALQLAERASPRPAAPNSPETNRSARLQAEFDNLSTRIRYLTRVHWSLLRHLNRSLAILHRVVDSCAPTYTPQSGMLDPEIRIRAGE